jgi:hypothetical protein
MEKLIISAGILYAEKFKTRELHEDETVSILILISLSVCPSILASNNVLNIKNKHIKHVYCLRIILYLTGFVMSWSVKIYIIGLLFSKMGKYFEAKPKIEVYLINVRSKIK